MDQGTPDWFEARGLSRITPLEPAPKARQHADGADNLTVETAGDLAAATTSRTKKQPSKRKPTPTEPKIVDLDNANADVVQ